MILAKTETIYDTTFNVWQFCSRVGLKWLELNEAAEGPRASIIFSYDNALKLSCRVKRLKIQNLFRENEWVKSHVLFVGQLPRKKLNKESECLSCWRCWKLQSDASRAIKADFYVPAKKLYYNNEQGEKYMHIFK